MPRALPGGPQLLKRCQYVLRVLITDKLGSYEAAKMQVMPGVEHRRHRRLNNRAEHSHQPARQRGRTMNVSSRQATPNAFYRHLGRFVSTFYTAIG